MKKRFLHDEIKLRVTTKRGHQLGGEIVVDKKLPKKSCVGCFCEYTLILGSAYFWRVAWNTCEAGFSALGSSVATPLSVAMY